MRRGAFVAFAVVLCASSTARAQQFSVTGGFRPAASPLNYLVTEDARVLPHLQPSAGLFLSYVHHPLRLVDRPGASDSSLVQFQLNMDLMLAIGLFDRFELGAALPLTLAQSGDDLQALGRAPADTLSAGIGDIRIIPKVHIVSAGFFSLSLSLPVSLPSGSGSNLLGGGVAFAPRLIGSVAIQRVRFALNLGYRTRKDQSFVAPDGKERVTIDDEVFSSLGVRVRLWRRKLEAVGDFYWSVGVKEQNREEIPVELAYGLRYNFKYGISSDLAIAHGLTQGIGAPAFRVIAGVTYRYLRPKPLPKATPVDPDRDKDGILNASDKCPDTPEDKDGFEDSDGCPDDDNDKDGIVDKRDKCPNKPEDKDGFEDADGCPDPDNDKDGIADGEDKCPNKPEDKDGFEDADGCPDLDNDKDGIPDKLDKCPNEPEVFNKVDDEDGCPDKGKGKVQIQHGRVTVPTVYFATNRDRVLRRSFGFLREAAQLLRDNKWIKKVRIEGHTDDRGSDAFNLALSQRRADNVRKFLVKHGVPPERVEAKGYGETRPIASNKRRRGRQKNRRVDFVIIDPPPQQK